jgi:hypothetical protein
MTRDRARRDRYAAIFTARAPNEFELNVDSDIRTDDREIITSLSPTHPAPRIAKSGMIGAGMLE